MTEQQKVRLRVVSRMVDPDGGVMETKNARKGTLCDTADGLVLAYEDEQEDERAHIELTMRAGRTPGENRAQMLRKGMMSGRLAFVPGQRMSGSYVTIYGEIPVAVDTRRVGILRSTEGGSLTLDYDVYMGGEKTSSAVMEITWRF